jgi:two-component system chemotaxis response regulator CheY
MHEILVVDDSAYARKVLKQTLEGAGYGVREAASGMGAIESYFLSRPDVVLLDLTMEDMGGLEVLTRLRQLDEKACVIVISADVQASTEDEVKEAGALRFMGKPAAPEAILNAIKTAMVAQK